MRLAVITCVLAFFVASSVHSQLVIPQIPADLKPLVALLPDILNFVDKIPTIAPEIANVLSSSEFQSFKEKVVQVLISQIAQHGGISGIKDKLQALLGQFLNNKPQVAGRIDWDPILNNLINSLPSALLGAVGGIGGIFGSLFGKRSVEEGRGLDEIFALADKFQVNTLFPIIAQLVSSDKLQELQTQLLDLALGALGNNWNLNSVSQLLQQIVTGLAPQAKHMRIDWDALGQTVLEGAAQYVLPGLISIISIFGKRDVVETTRVNFQQLISSLPLQKIAQLARIVLNAHKDTIQKVLAQLKTLLQQFFPQQVSRVNFDDLADFFMNAINNILPNLNTGLLQQLLG